MAKAAAGSGSIRKKTVTRSGKQYTYWEARYTVPGTGKRVQRSITGKTQKEVAQKLKEATASIDAGTYIAPSKMTVGEWMDIWTANYLGGVKPRTVDSYKTTVRLHIKPELGKVRLEVLTAHMIQIFYNGLSTGDSPLSPKSVKNVHGILHRALSQAVKVGYIRFNPAGACELPRIERRELRPLDENESRAFLEAIQGHRFETLYTVTLFTGMREGEVLGLKWDRVDFQRGTILIDQQLQQPRQGNRNYFMASTKSGKARTVTPAPWVMELMKHHRATQAEQRLKAGRLWEDSGLVFTDELGHHLTHAAVYQAYKKVVSSIGRSDARFHDLRHSYAVAAIRAGDDIKTVQGNMGHSTAAFTLDVYGHVTDQMKRDSAARMEGYIKQVLGL